jgi:tRNA/tmRNA/rRNA uracil-C5-methylase (TrmA/RlmC/RlmD family)
MRAGDILSLTIEKAAAGGRMLARHDGQVVLVSGAIPGERVQARIDRVKGGVGFASTIAVEAPSPDRRPSGADASCGGNVFAHVAYARQLALKQDIVRDAFQRIAHLALPGEIRVHPSPERGYRMRARLHMRGDRLGFYREGTHTVCDPAATGQLLDSTLEIVRDVSETLRSGGVMHASSLDISENIDATERAIALELSSEQRERGKWEGVLTLQGVTGATVQCRGQVLASRGDLSVRDRLRVPTPTGMAEVTLARQVGAFFQGNRYLLLQLVERVHAQLPDGALVDLYAGSGLFGLAHASAGRGAVTLVESDRLALDDLQANAQPFASAVTVIGAPVEQFLESRPASSAHSMLVDPPRSGLSRAVAGALSASTARRLVYVSCDVATLARDARTLTDGGFHLVEMELFDFFPNTAHVETVSVFDRY